jgi:hypothetical protein
VISGSAVLSIIYSVAGACLLGICSTAIANDSSPEWNEFSRAKVPTRTVYFRVTRFQDTMLKSIDDINEETCVEYVGNWNVHMYTKKGYTQVEHQNHYGKGKCSGVLGTYTELWYTWTEGCTGQDAFRALYQGNGEKRFKFVITCSEESDAGGDSPAIR